MDDLSWTAMEQYSPEVLWIVILGFVMAFILAFGIGANDVANSFGTSVGSKVLSIRQACILATIFEILGAVLIGYKVSDTVRKGILDLSYYHGQEKQLMLGFLSSLCGSALLLIGATFFKMPVSGTHSIVGATVGFSVVVRGFVGINWKTLLTIVGSWFISPVLSGSISVVIFLIIRKFIIQSSSPLKRGLLALPFFYGFTIFINVFSIVHEGPKLLHMDNIQLWIVLLLSVALGLFSALCVQFFFAPWLKKKILAETKVPKIPLDSKPNFTYGGDTDESSQESSPKISRSSVATENEKAKEKRSKLTNGKSKAFKKLPENGVYKKKEEGKRSANNQNQSPYIIAETNLGVNMNPKTDLPKKEVALPSGQVTPVSGLTPNSSAVPLVRPLDNKENNSGASAEDGEKPHDDPPEVGKLFSFLQILTATFGSFAHGGNDVSNAIGPLIALFLIYANGGINQKAETPLYILLYGGVGISIGLWVWGKRVIETIGEDLTKITASTGFTIELGAAFTVLLASKIGLPISTTHCKVGSVVFVGWASSSRKGVDWSLFRNIISAWIVTVPLSAGLSAAFMAFLQVVVM